MAGPATPPRRPLPSFPRRIPGRLPRRALPAANTCRVTAATSPPLPAHPLASSSSACWCPPQLEGQQRCPPLPALVRLAAEGSGRSSQTPASNPSEEAEDPQTLERAEVLFHQGSKAIEDGDFVEVVDCLSRALEISRAAHYGELAPRVCQPILQMSGSIMTF